MDATDMLAGQKKGPTGECWKCSGGMTRDWTGFRESFDWTYAWNSNMEHRHKGDWDRVRVFWNVKYVINHATQKTKPEAAGLTWKMMAAALL